jgi:hypothetical protein
VGAVEADEVEAAAEALAAKANKSITPEVVSEVAKHAEVEVDEETATAISEAAAAIQAGESESPGDDDTSGSSATDG